MASSGGRASPIVRIVVPLYGSAASSSVVRLSARAASKLLVLAAIGWAGSYEDGVEALKAQRAEPARIALEADPIRPVLI